MKCPLLVAAIAFAIGIALTRADLSASGSFIPLLLSGSAAFMLAGLFVLRRHKDSQALTGRRTVQAAALALAGFALAGAAATQLFDARFPPGDMSRWRLDDPTNQAPVMLTGYLVSRPLRSSELEFDLEATEVERDGRAIPTSGRIRIWVRPPSSADSVSALNSLRLAYGDVIRAPVQLRQPRVYRNPGSFDFRRRMREIEDVYWEGSIRDAASIAKLPANRASWASRAFARVRERLLEGIDRIYPPWSLEGTNGAVLKAVLLGDRSSLDTATVENFRQSGLYHLLVIAGLHVGLLAALVGGLLRLLGLRNPWRSALLLLLLVVYSGLVEQRAPTLRATLMIAVWLLAGFLDRRHSALNAIGIAALVLLIARPAWLFETGFQLSFSAALLIAGVAAPILARSTEPYRNALFFLHAVDRDAALGPRPAQFRLDLRALAAWLRGRSGFLSARPAVAEACVTVPVRAVLWTVNIVLFSAILQLGLLLPMVETFHRVTFAGIGLNALAIPVMAALLAVALPTTLLAAVLPSLAVFPARVLGIILNALFALARLPRSASWLSYRIPAPPAWVGIGFALSLVVAAVALGRSRRLTATASVGFALFALLLCLHPFAPRLPRGAMEVTALDCGGGQALFVVLPDGTTVLVGACGGRGRYGRGEGRAGVVQARAWNPGENIVSPYLWSRGLKRIDIAVLPAWRSDDAAGLSSVIANLRVGELWLGPLPQGALDDATALLLVKADQRAVRVREVASGDRLAYGPVELQILWPPRGEDRGEAGSLIVRTAGERASVLAVDEADPRAETSFAGAKASLESQVLALGSDDASLLSDGDFLASVHPRVALLSPQSGRATGWQSSAVERLQALGTRVFRTDHDGAITVMMKGSSLSVRTESQRDEQLRLTATSR